MIKYQLVVINLFTYLCRGLFFLPHQTKPKVSNFALRAQGELSPVVYDNRKTRVNSIGPTIKPKAQAGPLNLKPMSAVMISDHSKQFKEKRGKRLPRDALFPSPF